MTKVQTRTIAYWIATAATAFVFLSGGVADLSRPEFVMEGMRHLGYPDYFVVILGAWKLLGGIVVLVPRFPRLKEWAYAGMLFDLSGAAASHLSAQDSALKIATPLLLLIPLFASWALRPESRRLADAAAK